MKTNDDAQSSDPVPDPTALRGTEAEDLDGDFPIEGDTGVVDSAGQAHIPPPPPVH